MTKEKLIKSLVLLQGVKSVSWGMVRQIVAKLQTDSIEVISKKWDDSYNEKYVLLDLSNIKTWSTYDNTCIDLFFTHQNKKLKCTAKIYDGESLGGYRTGLRFSAELLLSDDFIVNLDSLINCKLNDYLNDAYENHLQAQKKLWMENLKKELLK
jgi:hypothetical protein